MVTIFVGRRRAGQYMTVYTVGVVKCSYRVLYDADMSYLSYSAYNSNISYIALLMMKG